MRTRELRGTEDPILNRHSRNWYRMKIMNLKWSRNCHSDVSTNTGQRDCKDQAPNMLSCESNEETSQPSSEHAQPWTRNQ